MGKLAAMGKKNMLINFVKIIILNVLLPQIFELASLM